MDVFSELLKSDVGILSSITIVVCILIAAFLANWVRKQVKKDEAKYKQDNSNS